MTDTIFSKVISGDIPCHKIYEDAHVLAFLDIVPLSRGHTLLIPKQPAEMIHELSDETAAALGRVLPRICRAVLRATGATGYNILQNNGTLAHQAVMHVHFHVIPKYSQDSGLCMRWDTVPLDPTEGSRLAKAIADELMA